VLAFTDADCVPAPGWLRAALGAMADADIAQGPVLPAAPAAPTTARDLALAMRHAAHLGRGRAAAAVAADAVGLAALACGSARARTIVL